MTGVRMKRQDTLPDSDLYIVYSMSTSSYQQWQADLLDFSVQAVGQPGQIVRLCAREVGAHPGIQKSASGYTFETPAYSEVGNRFVSRVVVSIKRRFNLRLSGRFHFYCLNKPFAMQAFLHRHPQLDDDAKLLWLDPDMVFIQPWSPPDSLVRSGHVTGQYWWHYVRAWCEWYDSGNGTSLCPDTNAAIMFPFCITVGDMRAIVDSYIHYSAEIYRRTRNWESEMYGHVMAMQEAGLTCHAIPAFGTCNNWPDGMPDNAEAPISHYTQVVKDRHGREIWDKREYTALTSSFPWKRPPLPQMAATLTDQRSLAMIHRYIDWQEQQQARPNVSQTRS